MATKCFIGIAVLLSANAFMLASEKDAFTLLRPTPPALMREMATDRPDKTEVPFTIDAGHVQTESDIVSYAYDDTDGTRTDAWAVMPTNIRVGVLNNTELGIVIEPYLNERTKSGEGRERRQGYGTTTIRIKQNLWGNDPGNGGGKTGFAIMPYIALPTSQEELGADKIEFGVVLPLSIDLTDRLSLGLMTEANWLRDEEGDGYHFESVGTAVLGYAITEKLGGFVEIFASVDYENPDDWISTFDCGLTYALTDNIQLDAGVYIGLTDAADDLNPFVGLSVRL